MTILLTGATGFVGSHVRDALVASGVSVCCTSRDPKRAAARDPSTEWRRLDVTEPASIREALVGCSSAIYLVHSMGEAEDYATVERRAAHAFAEACQSEGLMRVVYLGGVAPVGLPSPHLRSRLETGRILREETEGVVELRAAMVIGAGSESWRICRDLAVRLPLMVLPRWLENRSCPVSIVDVVAAIAHAALHVDEPLAGCYDIPGPECMSAQEILKRIGRLRGIDPYAVRLPVLTPRLSSYWLKLVSGANYEVAKELVEGLKTDLLPTCPLYWDRMGQDHQLQSFDDAARAAMDEEDLGAMTRLLEKAVQRISRSPRGHDP